MFRNILIEVNSADEFRNVQKILFDEGNFWSGPTKENYKDYTYDITYVRCSDAGNLWHGTNETKNAAIPQPKVYTYEEFMHMSINGEEVEGLRSIKEFNKDRIVEILAAMTRYMKAKKDIPMHWQSELNILLNENRS